LNLNPKKRQHSNSRTLLQVANVVANKRKKLTKTKKQTLFLAIKQRLRNNNDQKLTQPKFWLYELEPGF
jgi:hypothetical protein